jgi:hypothetical protein
MNGLVKALLAILGVGAVVAIASSKEDEPKKKETTQTKKGKYTPQPYSVSLKKYGHLKSLKDYPKKIRWYEPNGEYENRTFEKWDDKNDKWIEIDSVEFDYYETSAEDNTDYEYKRKAKNEGGKRVFYLQKMTA